MVALVNLRLGIVAAVVVQAAFVVGIFLGYRPVFELLANGFVVSLVVLLEVVAILTVVALVVFAVFTFGQWAWLWVVDRLPDPEPKRTARLARERR